MTEGSKLNKKAVLFISIPVIILIIINYMKPYDYATDEPFITISSASAGLEERINFYPTIISMDVEGNVTLYSAPFDKVLIMDDAPVFETKVSKEKVKEIQAMVEQYHFMRKRRNISDKSSLDGGYQYITVNLKDTSKTVGGRNTLDEEFLDLFDAVSSTIDKEDASKWHKELKEYIVKEYPSME